MCAKEESFQVERAIDYILFKGIKFVEMYFLLFNDFNLYFFFVPKFLWWFKEMFVSLPNCGFILF